MKSWSLLALGYSLYRTAGSCRAATGIATRVRRGLLLKIPTAYDIENTHLKNLIITIDADLPTPQTPPSPPILMRGGMERPVWCFHPQGLG